MWAPDPPPSRRPSISMILAILFASTTCYLLFVSTHAPDANHPNGIQAQQDNFQSSSLFPHSTLLQHDPEADMIPTIPAESTPTTRDTHKDDDEHDNNNNNNNAVQKQEDDDQHGDKNKKHKSTHNEDHEHDEDKDKEHDKEHDKDKEDKEHDDADKNKRKKQDGHDHDEKEDKDKDKKKKHKKQHDHDEEDHGEDDKKDMKKNKKTRDHDDDEEQDDKDKKKDKKNKKNKDEKNDKNKNKKHDHEYEEDHDDDKNKPRGDRDKKTNQRSSSHPYRVLLFGDSITYGTGPSPLHPYAIRLQEKFDKHGIIVELNNQGIKANTVVKDPYQTSMVDRLPPFLPVLPVAPPTNASHDTAPVKGETLPPKFDMVIILGGTNDIGASIVHGENISPSDTLTGLIAMHEGVRANGAITVAVTVPERKGEIQVKPPYVKKDGQPIGDSKGEQFYSYRMSINQGLEDYCTQHQPVKHGRTATGEMPCLLVDFAHEIPYKKQKFWIDGLHPSSAGYDRLGDVIWDVIEPYVG